MKGGEASGGSMKNYEVLVSVNVIRAAVSAIWQLTEVRILPSHRHWKTEAQSFLMITSQRNGFQIL